MEQTEETTDRRNPELREGFWDGKEVSIFYFIYHHKIDLKCFWKTYKSVEQIRIKGKWNGEIKSSDVHHAYLIHL